MNVTSTIFDGENVDVAFLKMESPFQMVKRYRMYYQQL